MPKSIWKEYEANPLTHSAAHYLMTIRTLLQERGYARVTDIARALNITRGSCSISLKPLKRRGLVLEDDNKFLQLSAEGDRLAQLVEKNDLALVGLLHEVMGVEVEQAEIDACKIEHLLSLETSLKLAGFLGFMRSGSKTVKSFMRELGKFNATCAGNVVQCKVCDTVCLAEAKPVKRA